MSDGKINTRPHEITLLKGVFNKDLARRMIQTVNSHHFGNEDTMAVWRAFRKMHFAGVSVTPEALAIEVGDIWGESQGETDQLVQEIDQQEEPADLDFLIKGLGILQSRKKLSELMEYLGTAEALKNGMSGAMTKINEFVLTHHDVSAKKAETLTDTMKRIMGREGPEKTWAPGFGRLDNVWKIRKGSYGIVAGDSGSGKTSAMINMVLSVAKQDTHAGVISIEMTADELTFRAAAMEAGIDAERIEDNLLSPAEREQIFYTMDQNKEVYDRIHVIDPATVSAEELHGYYNDLIRRHGCEVIFLDYVQRVSSKNKNIVGKTDTTTQASETITAVTKATGVATVALSVLNRASFGGNSAGLNSLKHSGQLGHDGHWVVIIEKGDDADPSAIPIIFRAVKNRKGRFFNETLELNGPTQRISEAARPFTPTIHQD